MKSFLLIMVMAAALPVKALANPACAVCTVAIGASLSVARKMGVEDSIVGLWAGALLTLLGYWSIMFFDKRNWHFRGRDFLLLLLSVGMIGFIYVAEVDYTPVVIWKIFYMDTILFSSLLGMLIYIGSQKLYQRMKAGNGGHAHFPFEKVVLPIVFFAGREFVFNLFSDLRRRIEAVKKITVGFQTGGYFNGCLITFFSRQTMSL